MLFNCTIAWREDHLSLFSGLVAEKVALLSLCPSIEISRNPITGSCLGFPLLPTAGKEKNHHFYSTASFHPSIPKLFANSEPLGPDIPTKSQGLSLLLGALSAAARDGEPGQKLHPMMPGPPQVSPLLAGHLSPPVPVKVPVPRAAQL